MRPRVRASLLELIPRGFIRTIGRALTAAISRLPSSRSTSTVRLRCHHVRNDGRVRERRGDRAEALLQSPHFVYRSELGDDGARLSGYEVASKLSFLLRNTMPSDALLDAAGRGDLDTRAGSPPSRRRCSPPTTRRPSRPRSTAPVRAHPLQPDREERTLFPNYTDAVNPRFQEGEALFFDRIFEQGLGFRDILTTTVGFVNSTLAPFYGVNVTGAAFQEVDLGADARASRPASAFSRTTAPCVIRIPFTAAWT
jgi:hypothetical protein